MLEDNAVLDKAQIESMLRVDARPYGQESESGLQFPSPGELSAIVSWIGLRLEELERCADRGDDAYRDAHRALARETLERTVPLADHIGLQILRKRLEDASFRLLEPRLYAELARRVAQTQAEDEMCLVVLQAGIRRLLAEHEIAGLVQGRIKGLYSLYRKMRRLNCPLESIIDRIGLRVIVASVHKCYEVLALLHTRLRPMPGTFDDYIAHPKANGYRSLHICMYPVPDLSYKPVEFQIRTAHMHQMAQCGAAAHWRYKIEEDEGSGGEARLKWFCDLLDQREPNLDRAAFLQRLYHQVFDDRLAILCEGGQSA